jgi:hypothetical protein
VQDRRHTDQGKHMTAAALHWLGLLSPGRAHLDILTKSPISTLSASQPDHEDTGASGRGFRTLSTIEECWRRRNRKAS